MSKREYHQGDTVRVEMALADLKSALRNVNLAGAGKTARRVRLAISSCKGALRNIEMLRREAERKARGAAEGAEVRT